MNLQPLREALEASPGWAITDVDGNIDARRRGGRMLDGLVAWAGSGADHVFAARFDSLERQAWVRLHPRPVAALRELDSHPAELPRTWLHLTETEFIAVIALMEERIGS
ncbi:hypothetical protein [Actinokineospora spheciospongiae]|uniref:hypothetical protein n=1 Tax=Actinokineospora spheciospongiae TaxID=909613 RepID=UPI000D8B322F|nr:hypothetical protein [Actinokineospora spheciospongiae]PWW65992.1 hypothetical protein DFQ13_102754 [Actinokineospora spheciospongiae]